MTASVHDIREIADQAQFRSVEIAARHDNRDAWELADAIYEDVSSLLPADEGIPSSAAHGVKTGLSDAEQAVYDAHREAGTEVGRAYVHNLYVTRRVWPPEERLPEKASFDAHFELRGKDWRNRREIIERLAARSRTGRVSRQQVVIYRSEKKPPALKTFRELFESRVRAVAVQAGKPWHTVAEEDRYALARIMRDIANEIEAGTFGVKA